MIVAAAGGRRNWIDVRKPSK